MRLPARSSSGQMSFWKDFKIKIGWDSRPTVSAIEEDDDLEADETIDREQHRSWREEFEEACSLSVEYVRFVILV
jgi:hypothetical protein